MEKIVIGNCTTNHLLSKLIKWFIKRFPLKKAITKKIPSHSWAAGYSKEFDSVIVLESTWYGYRPTEWKRWIKKREITDAYFNTKTDMKKSIKWAGKQLGTSYDYKSLFTFIWKYFLYLFGLKWIKHPFNTPTSMHCSEAKTRFLQEEGYFTNVYAEGVTPLDLRQLIQSNKHFIEVTEQVKSGEWWNEKNRN